MDPLFYSFLFFGVPFTISQLPARRHTHTHTHTHTRRYFVRPSFRLLWRSDFYGAILTTLLLFRFSFSFSISAPLSLSLSLSLYRLRIIMGTDDGRFLTDRFSFGFFAVIAGGRDRTDATRCHQRTETQQKQNTNGVLTSESTSGSAM